MADQLGSSTTTQTASQQANPLSRKLNKILETRLENDKVREQFLITILCFHFSFSKVNLMEDSQLESVEVDPIMQFYDRMWIQVVNSHTSY